MVNKRGLVHVHPHLIVNKDWKIEENAALHLVLVSDCCKISFTNVCYIIVLSLNLKCAAFIIL